MATGKSAPAILAPAFRRLPNTLDRMLRELRAAEEPELRVPSGNPGGGKGSAHYGPDHLANVLLADAGDRLPRDAQPAARTLWPLRCARERVESPVKKRITIRGLGERGQLHADVLEFRPGSGEHLRDYLARQIEAIGDADIRAAWAERYGASWRLTMCLDPASAAVSWVEPDGARHVLEFEPETAQPDLLPQPVPPPMARTQRILTFAALAACGVCWEDTLAHRPDRQLSLPAPDIGNTTAGPGNGSAGPATTAEPAPTKTTRPRNGRAEHEDYRQLHNAVLSLAVQDAESLSGGPPIPNVRGTDPPWTPMPT